MGGADTYPAMLDALHAEVAPGRLIPAPSGCVLASTGAPGRTGPPSLARLGLGCSADPMTTADEAETARFAEGLLSLQSIVLSRALRYTIDHLGQRGSEGVSLLTRPQIQADLAEVAMVLQEAAVQCEPAGYSGAGTRWARHLRLADAGRVLMRLLGGHSMLLGSPAADIYLTEVAGNTYLQPGAGDCYD